MVLFGIRFLDEPAFWVMKPLMVSISIVAFGMPLFVIRSFKRTMSSDPFDEPYGDVALIPEEFINLRKKARVSRRFPQSRSRLGDLQSGCAERFVIIRPVVLGRSV